jgi:hypothetical protein
MIIQGWWYIEWKRQFKGVANLTKLRVVGFNESYWIL